MIAQTHNKNFHHGFITVSFFINDSVCKSCLSNCNSLFYFLKSVFVQK